MLEFIKETIGKSLAAVLLKLFDAVKSVAELASAVHETKQKKEQAEQQKKNEIKIDAVADSGTMDDLLDLGKGRT